ncbi:MAG: radical SAM protein [Candidatus Omnitrophica bacterium]|nr:radical SAM protein [Candidatus Omnitrophota bacterium]
MDQSRKIKDLWKIVLIELTNCCNFSCEFCPIDISSREKSMMKREVWKKLLSELSEKKMTERVFFHLLGEPLLHKDVFDAIQFANDKGLFVSLYTNGAVLNNDTSEKLLSTLKIGHIVLSLQEISPEAFSKKCHSPISWTDYLDQIKKFMLKAEEYKKTVQIHYMVDTQDLGWDFLKISKQQKQLQSMYNDWCKMFNNLNPDRINILNPSKSYKIEASTSFFLKHKGNWDNHFIDNTKDVINSDTGHCAMLTDTFAILADGTCTYCCGDFDGALDLGNAEKDSLENIYYGEKATSIRKAAKEGTMIHDRCKRCRGTLIDKKTRKPVLRRNYISDFYLFNDHLQTYGLSSAIKKTFESIKRKSKKGS